MSDNIVNGVIAVILIFVLAFGSIKLMQQPPQHPEIEPNSSSQTSK